MTRSQLAASLGISAAQGQCALGASPVARRPQPGRLARSLTPQALCCGVPCSCAPDATSSEHEIPVCHPAPRPAPLHRLPGPGGVRENAGSFVPCRGGRSGPRMSPGKVFVRVSACPVCLVPQGPCKVRNRRTGPVGAVSCPAATCPRLSMARCSSRPSSSPLGRPRGRRLCGECLRGVSVHSWFLRCFCGGSQQQQHCWWQCQGCPCLAAPSRVCARSHRQLRVPLPRSPSAAFGPSGDGGAERDPRGLRQGSRSCGAAGGGWPGARRLCCRAAGGSGAWPEEGRRATPSPSFCCPEGPDYGGGLLPNEPPGAAGSAQSSAGGTGSSTRPTGQDEASRLF